MRLHRLERRSIAGQEALGQTRGPLPPGVWDDPTALEVEVDEEVLHDLRGLRHGNAEERQALDDLGPPWVV